MEDFRLYMGFRDHPKVTRLEARLGDRGVLAWITLIDAAARYKRDDGEFTGMTRKEVETFARWKGKSGALIQALLDFRLLDNCGEHLGIHGWKKRQPHLAKAKWRSEINRANATKTRDEDHERPSSKTLAQLEAEQLGEDR